MDEKLIDDRVREGVAMALEAVATALEGGLGGQDAAALLRGVADGVMDRSAPVSAAPMKLSIAPLDGSAPAPAEGEPDEEFPVLRLATEGDVFLLADGSELTPAMLEWLDEFDDRIRLSPHFTDAVNEAAEAGLTLNSNATAQMVADRVGELTEAARSTGEPEEPEAEQDGPELPGRPRSGTMRAARGS